MSEQVKKNKNPRRAARECAVQAIYQWQISAADASEIIQHFMQYHDFHQVDKAYWQELVTQSIQHAADFDEKMQPFLSRSVQEITPVELSILRVAFYELASRLDIPYRVVINEAVELAKIFGASDSHRFINGVLDVAAKKLRATEISMRNKNNS
jgi:N utilization substance protein B